MSDATPYKVKRAVADYIREKVSKGEKEPTDSEIGFIEKNRVVGLSVSEIDGLLRSAKKLSGGEITGTGDRFREWCVRWGRPVPSDELVSLMNRSPHDAGVAVVKASIPEHPLIYRAYCSFVAGRGRSRV